jgi:hypothetical protein
MEWVQQASHLEIRELRQGAVHKSGLLRDPGKGDRTIAELDQDPSLAVLRESGYSTTLIHIAYPR